MTVPYTFGTATTSIPLSNLDANFNTPITLGNTSIYLGNTTTTIGNLTLTNATISSGNIANITITNVSVTTANVTNITVTGTANIATGNVTTLSSTSITDSGLTSGRVTYAGTAGLLQDDADFTFNGTTVTMANDASISGLTVGRGAGAIATNTVLGASALAFNLSGTLNIAIGANSNKSTTGSNNIGIGQYTLGGNAAGATGSSNIGLGDFTMFQLTSGTANIAIGQASQQFTAVGNYNVSIGNSSLLNNIASGSVAIGYEALFTSSGAAPTLVAIGYQAGRLYNGAGSNQGQVYIGAGAGQNNVSGIDNTYVGGYAGFYATGSYNTALGSGALSVVTASSSGSNNTAVGYRALYANTTAGDNVAVGYEAGYTNLTGNSNVYIGKTAGHDSTGSKNVFIGYQSGYYATGNGNTFVGTKADGTGSGQNVTSGSKNTILGGFDGNQSGLNISTASNYIVLSDGDGNPRGIFDGSGYFLVNTTSVNNAGAISLDFNGQTQQGMTFDDTYASTGGYYVLFRNSAGATAGYIDHSGTTTVAYNTSSDYRLKENIVPMTGALAKVAQLKPVTYNWKEDGSDGQGFIAHELAEVVPDCVSGEKDAVYSDGSIKPQGVDTSFLVATLTAAIQELKAEFDAYKATHP